MNNQTPLEAWADAVGAILAEGRDVELAPKGLSMWPALRPSTDVVTLRAADSYARGEMVLAVAHSPRGVFLHRVVEVRPDGYVLMGDSNLYQREHCAPGAVLGKVVAIRRRGRDASRSAAVRLMASLTAAPPLVRRTIVRLLNLFRNEKQ